MDALLAILTMPGLAGVLALAGGAVAWRIERSAAPWFAVGATALFALGCVGHLRHALRDSRAELATAQVERSAALASQRRLVEIVDAERISKAAITRTYDDKLRKALAAKGTKLDGPAAEILRRTIEGAAQ